MQIPVHECQIHGRCTLGVQLPALQCCARCPDASPKGDAAGVGAIRHMTYFCAPLGTVWQWNLREVLRRISLFNGRRLMVVVEGGGLAPRNLVEHELRGCGVEVTWLPNDPHLKEYVGFPHLLRSLSHYTSDQDVAWYGHAKGVTSEGWGTGVRRWTASMYSALLDYWPSVRAMLQTHASCGVWKKRQGWFPANASTWHYMGSHRWIRNRDLYAKRWDEYIVDWCCPEAHIGGVLRWEEAGCLYGEMQGGPPQLYLAEGWAGWPEQQQRQWEESHMADRETPLLVCVVICSCRKPRTIHDAIRSVIRQTTDSWRLVVIDSGELLAAGEFERYRLDARITCIASGEAIAMPQGACAQSWCHNEVARRGHLVGDLVVYLSDDDVLAPGILAQYIGAARAHPDQSAWVAPCEVVRLHEGGREEELGRLPTEAITGPVHQLDGRVDGMQVCIRRGIIRDWPEDGSVAPHADGVWMDSWAHIYPAHPLPELCGRHRRTPWSTYTKE